MANVRVADDITAIAGYAERYAPQIILQLLQGLSVVEDVEVIYDLSSTLHLPKYVAGKGFRPEDTSIDTQSGQSGKFSKRSITPEVGMKIIEIIPAEFRRTYMSDQMKPNAKELPFSEYFWKAQNAKLKAEIDESHYFGQLGSVIPTYNPANTYPAGARVKYNKDFYKANASVLANEVPGVSVKWDDANASSINKGFGTIIEEDINQFPAQNKVATGVLTADDAHDQVNELYQALPEVYKKFGGVIYCSHNSRELYRQSTLAKFPANESIMANRGNVSDFLFGSEDKWRLKAVDWMAGSGRLIGTPDPARVKNLHMATNVLSDFESIGKVIETLHGNKSVMKMSMAFQIADTEITFINDQK